VTAGGAAPAIDPLAGAEVIDELASFGIRAFTTGRAAGSFGLHGAEPVGEVMARWDALRRVLSSGGPRLASAHQIHGDRVVVHGGAWEGWLRVDAADGHATREGGTALVVTVADCVPVFVAHPSGATALLHSGWRGTEANILAEAVRLLEARGLRAAELRVAMGAAICGRCYEVSPDVHRRLTGREVMDTGIVDPLRIIADHARAAGVRHITTSASCTKCDNDRFFSHRAGDSGRQLGVLIAERM